jgi:hypothetical protein
MGRVRDYLQGPGRVEQLERLDEVLASLRTLSPRIRNDVLSAADQALAAAGNGINIDATGKFGLEALVALTGRPALRTRNGDIQLDDPRGAEWADRLYMPVSSDKLKRVIDAVGRVDLNGRHIGTGFLVAPDLVLTNRHVLQELAAPIPTLNNPSGWLLDERGATIDFSDNPSSATLSSKFKVLEVIAWGARDIDDTTLDLSLVDAALLRIETQSAGLAPAATIAVRRGVKQGRSLQADPDRGIPGHARPSAAYARWKSRPCRGKSAGRAVRRVQCPLRFPGEIMLPPDRESLGQPNTGRCATTQPRSAAVPAPAWSRWTLH